ncbi:MAG: hypothetical protein IKB24_01610 [Alistipes sp.]|nr:hypothetical protein [Alistipes sp.]
MRKFLVLLLLVAMTIPVAEARRRETPEEIERKTRHYQGWEKGVSLRASLIFYELDRTRIVGEKAVRTYTDQAKFGGNVMLHAGYFINNHWKVGAEIGAQIQYNHTVIPVYATAHYYYGTRKNCLFNFVNLGTNLLFDKGIRLGSNCAGGVGYRIQAPDSKYKYDIMVGYQATLLRPRPEMEGIFQYKESDVKRHEFNQGVFIGFTLTF